MIADIEAQIVAEAIDATIDKLSAALGVPKPTVDAKAWADLALMRLRVTAWARDCVTHGDLTPAGERSLLRILGQQTTATLNPVSIPAGEADTPTEGETGSQQQCRVCLSYGICYMPKRCPKEVR